MIMTKAKEPRKARLSRQAVPWGPDEVSKMRTVATVNPKMDVEESRMKANPTKNNGEQRSPPDGG